MSETRAFALGFLPAAAKSVRTALASALTAAALLAAPLPGAGGEAFLPDLGSRPALASEVAALGEPVALRSDIRIQGDIVTLGDIFSGMGEAGETPVARAPEPGESVTLNARWLSRVAESYDVTWRPRSTLDATSLTREAQTLGQSAIVEALRSTLEERGVEDRIEIQLDNPGMRLLLPTTEPGIVTATSLSLNGSSGRFQAVLLAGDPTSPSQRLPIAGRVLRLVEVPVPSRRINAGEVISESDLEWMEVRADRLGPRDALNMDEMVGLSARRPLLSGEVVRLSQIEQPVLVNRNKLVTIELHAPSMRLSARGRALEDGARGDVVRVVNTASNKTVTGVVTAAATIAVDAGADIP